VPGPSIVLLMRPSWFISVRIISIFACTPSTKYNTLDIQSRAIPSMDDNPFSTRISGSLVPFKHCRPIESLIMSAQYTQLLRMSKSMAITFLMPKMGSCSRVFGASKLIREILSRCATRRNSGFSATGQGIVSGLKRSSLLTVHTSPAIFT